MAFTTVSNIIEFARLKYEDIRAETPTTSDYQNYYVANTPMFDSSTTTVTRNGTTVIASEYAVSGYLGKVSFTSANSSTDAIVATYTTCDLTSGAIENFISYSDTVISNTVSDTSRTSVLSILSSFLTSHLIYKNLAAKAGRGGMANYSIGFFSVGKGASPAMEISNMFYKNYEDWMAKLDTYKGIRMTWRQTGNDEWDKYYNKDKLVAEQDQTVRLTNSPGMTYET